MLTYVTEELQKYNSIEWQKTSTSNRKRNIKRVRNAIVTELYTEGHSIEAIRIVMGLSLPQARSILVRSGVYKSTAKRIADEEFGE